MPVGNLQNDRSQRAALAELQVTAAGLPASLALKQNVTFAPNELGTGTVERTLASKLGDVIGPKDAGATADGVTDDSAYLKAIIDAGNKEIDLLGKTYYIGTTRTIYLSDYTLFNGTLKYTDPDVVLNLVGNNVTLRDIDVVGSISSSQQYIASVNGVTSYFASPTYRDGTNTVDGTDFTHSVSGDIITLDLKTLSGAVKREVWSSFVTLNASKRYVVHFKDGVLSSGETSNCISAPKVYCYDASDVLLTSNGECIDANGLYDLRTKSAGSRRYMFISGAAKIKIVLTVSRDTRMSNTAAHTQHTLDLSKIQILELTNDLAALSTGAAWLETKAHLQFNGDRPRVLNLRARRCAPRVIQLVGATNALIDGVTSEQSFGAAVSYQNGSNNVIRNVRDSGMFLDDSGNPIPLLALRTHGVMGSGTEARVQVVGVRVYGKSWAFEDTSQQGDARYENIHGYDAKVIFSANSAKTIRKIKGSLQPAAYMGLELINSTGLCGSGLVEEISVTQRDIICDTRGISAPQLPVGKHIQNWYCATHSGVVMLTTNSGNQGNKVSDGEFVGPGSAVLSYSSLNELARITVNSRGSADQNELGAVAGTFVFPASNFDVLAIMAVTVIQANTAGVLYIFGPLGLIIDQLFYRMFRVNLSVGDIYIQSPISNTASTWRLSNIAIEASTTNPIQATADLFTGSLVSMVNVTKRGLAVNGISNVSDSYVTRSQPKSQVTSSITSGATPAVDGVGTLIVSYASATAMTGFSGGYEGQELDVYFGNGNATIDFTGTTLKGNGGADWSPGTGAWMRCKKLSGGNWRCLVDAAAT